MIYPFSPLAGLVVCLCAAGLLAMAFTLTRKARSVRGFYAAGGQVPWLINGLAFAGDYISAAMFLGICGIVAFYGYDGLLYGIGFLAGWMLALFLLADPVRRLGKWTFADALDARFNAPAIRIAAGISTLIICLVYLIPQMVGVGTLVKAMGVPAIHMGLIDIAPFNLGVVLVGGLAILIVVAAGMISTTWLQVIKGLLLVGLCAALAVGILGRGLSAKWPNVFPVTLSAQQLKSRMGPGDKLLYNFGPWAGQPFARIEHADGSISIWRFTGISRPSLDWPAATFTQCQIRTQLPGGEILVNSQPQTAHNDLRPVGFVASLPDSQPQTGAMWPTRFLAALEGSDLGIPKSATIVEENPATHAKVTHTIFYPEISAGSGFLVAGNSRLLSGAHAGRWAGRIDFISLMLALFCGAAVLPHVLIRYFTVKDPTAARRSTVVGIVAIGFFFLLAFYLGLGAMSSGVLDPTDPDMAVVRLAGSFGTWPLACLCGVTLLTVLGTVCGLMMAAAGTVAHDLLGSVFQMRLDDRGKVRAGKMACVATGIVAIGLGILCRNVSIWLLVGWAFNIAAAANLPALIMAIFWKRTTAKGIVASISVGLISSLIWVLLSADAFGKLYGLDLKLHPSPVPLNQPAVITIPLALVTLIVVSLATRPRAAK